MIRYDCLLARSMREGGGGGGGGISFQACYWEISMTEFPELLHIVVHILKNSVMRYIHALKLYWC